MNPNNPKNTPHSTNQSHPSHRDSPEQNPSGNRVVPSASSAHVPSPGSSLPEGVPHFGIPWVADFMGVSRRHVQRLIDNGALPNCLDFSQPKSSRKLLRIPRESILRYMARVNMDGE